MVGDLLHHNKVIEAEAEEGIAAPQFSLNCFCSGSWGSVATKELVSNAKYGIGYTICKGISKMLIVNICVIVIAHSPSCSCLTKALGDKGSMLVHSS